MLKMALGLIVLGVALVPFAQFSPHGNQSQATAAALQNGSVYQVIASNGDHCKIMLNPAIQDTQMAASPQADCISLGERVDSIRIWLALANGNISLRDYSNKELVVLHPAGPDVYKTTVSAALQLSVSRER